MLLFCTLEQYLLHILAVRQVKTEQCACSNFWPSAALARSTNHETLPTPMWFL